MVWLICKRARAATPVVIINGRRDQGPFPPTSCSVCACQPLSYGRRHDPTVFATRVLAPCWKGFPFVDLCHRKFPPLGSSKKSRSLYGVFTAKGVVKRRRATPTL